jgi:glucosyl-3-phosphoglycerate phosphatase
VSREKGRRVVLWRHGRTSWNADGRFQGQLDIDLDELGREQAVRAARLLAALGPELIVSSDLRRAADTAAELGRIMAKPVEVDARLRETYAGDWQGLTGAEIAARYPGEYSAWQSGDPELRVGGGESRADVAARMADAITDAAARLPEGGLAVLVTHGGAARLGVARLVGLPLERFTNLGGLSNGSWSLLAESSHGWVLVEHNAGTLPEPVSIEEG